MSKTVYTENVIDLQTGELFSKRWIGKKVESTEAFIKTYIEDIGALAKCSGAEQSTILCSLKYLDYNTNQLYIDSKRREEICECAGIKRNTLNSAISRLIKKNILIKESNTAYLLNPKLFFFGTELERDKLFSLEIRYEIVELKKS